jgi:hypothetical protein
VALIKAAFCALMMSSPAAPDPVSEANPDIARVVAAKANTNLRVFIVFSIESACKNARQKRRCQYVPRMLGLDLAHAHYKLNIFQSHKTKK